MKPALSFILISIFFTVVALFSELTHTSFVVIHNTKIPVEIANTEQSRQRGLGYRSGLPSYNGMLFLFDTKTQQSFWMKGMRFPIDILFIDGTTIKTIYKNVTPESPTTTDDHLRIYPSKVPIDKVLEINAGESDVLNLHEGDTVQFSL